MKTTDVSEYGDQSCSCTSCVYRSESDRPSLRRIISQGSRIDRLYYGKYIPLRERKLLEKLVRTRGVYDNIKAQLISSSTISIDTKSVFKPHRKLSGKKLNDRHHSDAILDLVDLVDKGEKLGSKELSGCCSCCSCSSKMNLHYKSTDKRRPKRAYPGAYKQIHIRENIGENRKRGVRFKTKYIKSDPCTCTFKFSGMLKKNSNAKLKKIRAYHPATFVDFMPPTDEKIHQKPKNTRHSSRSIENLQHSKAQVKDIMMEGFRKISGSKTQIQDKIDLHTKKSLDKLNKVKNNIKRKVNVGKKSREVPKNNNKATCECPEKDLMSQIKKDSINKFKDDLKRKRLLKDWECDSDCIEDICIPEECYYKLKLSRSGHLKPKHDKDNKDNIIIQDRTIGEPLINPIVKSQSKQLHKHMPVIVDQQKPILDEQQTFQINKPWLNGSTDKERKRSKKIQKDIIKVDKKKLKFQNVKSGALVPTTAVINKRTKDLTVSPPRVKGIHIYPKPKLENIRPESRQQVVRIGSSFTFNIEFYKNKADPSQNISRTNLQRLPNYSTQSLIKNNNKKFEKNIKFKTVNRRHQGSQIKLEYAKKNIKTGEDDSKRCFCPLKLKYKRKKIKDKATKEKSSITLNSVSEPCTPLDCKKSNKCNLIECKRENQKLLNNVETNTYYTYPNIIKIKKRGQKKFKDKQLLLPYECEPGVCIPDACDPYQCIKLISARKAKSKHLLIQCDCPDKRSYSARDISTSSLNTIKPKHLSLKPKFVKSLISQRSREIKNKVNKVKNIKTKYIKNASTSRNGRQVVRIGSTFSFNLEFHKTKSPNTLNSNNYKRISKETRPLSYKETSNQKSVEVTPLNKHLHKKTGFGTTLKRCFCTLKLQEKKNIKTKRKKILATGTDIVNKIHSNIVVTSNKSTKTNNRPLHPIACEPFVCIPGACDPYECLEHIHKRYKRLKEVGSITEHPENKSVSNTTYSNRSLKAVNIQSDKPYSKDRKSLVKPKNISDKLKRYTPSGKSNQAVKIGSSFSFNIEFIKTNKPVKKINSKLQMKQMIQQHSIKGKKNRRNINKLNVANVTTQVKGERKLSKASMADHFVKRCFCTLNLQKYRKHQPFIVPREYTINRAMTGLNPFLNSNGYKITSNGKLCVIDNNHKKDKSLSLNHPKSIHSQEGSSVVEKLSQSCSLNFLDDDKWASNFSFIENKVMYLKQMEITNLNKYVRQCFCTMNLQLVNQNISNKKPKSAIPFTAGKSPKNSFKNNKESTNFDKSSVRVGSTFSFNIDFSKNVSSLSKSRKYVDNLFVSKYSSDTELDKLEESKSKKIKNISINRHNISYHNRQSQSAIDELAHKASATMPIVRKCFCTLKLQKKGRWYKNAQTMKNSKKLLTNTMKPSLSKVTTVNRAQNTAFRPLNLAHSLKPYECEPNICNPSHCDPYHCLEIMKRKKFYKHTKESGIGTIQTKKSVSSLTIGNHSKATQKSYLLKVRPKQSEIKISGKKLESHDYEPSRQVVRVSSNFSFNIQFFKDQVSPERVQNISKDLIGRNQVKQSKNLLKIKKENKDQITSANSKFLRDKDTEVKKNPRIGSTVTTSAPKRCFCIAQLKNFKKKSVDVRLKNKSTFLNKCLCLFKSIRTSTAKNEGIHLNKVPHFDKKTNTQNVTLLDEHQRYPYECEPGICIPGECNPYECYKILKRRKIKTKSKASITAETKSTRSIYSNSDKLLTKNAKTQLRKRQKRRNIEKKSFSQSYLRDSDRKVVKIGSNFSFNIEFYKDKLAKYDRNLPLQQLYLKSKEKNNNEMNKNIIKNEILKTRSQRSQTDLIPKIDHSTENRQFLKRCFCTLQLYNKHSNVPNVQVKEKKKNQGIKLSTKSIMTKKDKHPLSIPKVFECEPNVCVPYQCDPSECEKNMKTRRKQKDSKEVGSSTKQVKKFAVSSSTNPLKKTRREIQTIVNKNYKKNISSYNDENAHYNNKYKESSPIHKVRIGSSFEFNVEFFKNKNNVGLEINKQPKLRNIKPRPTKEKVNKPKVQNRKHKKVMFEKNATKVTRSQSTMINVSPPSKRYKTMFYRKPKQEKHVTLKDITSSKGTETQKPLAHATLLPYECEPQICIPGECNPVECLERIKKRQKHFGGTTRFLQKTNTASTMTARKAKSKTRKNQFKSLNNDELRLKNESPNSNKQAVRIGSNFNFNIEFYKESAEPYTVSKKLNSLKKLRGKQKISEFKVNQLGSPPLKMKSQLSRPDNSILKRCFCMLKLQKQACVKSNCPELKANRLQKVEHETKYNTRDKNKIDKKIKTPTFLKKCLCVFKIRKIDKQKYLKEKNRKNLNSEIIKHEVTPRRLNQNISTQEELLPFECEPDVCLPGKCDPYECEKRIRKRILRTKIINRSNLSKLSATDKVKSRSIKIQDPTMKRQQHKKTLNSHTEPNRSLSNISKRDDNKDSVKFTKQSLEEPKKIINIPTFNTHLNKQAVKIGSNINFNIEFYKQTTSKMKSNTLENSQKLTKVIKNVPINSPIDNLHDKNISTKSAFIRNRGSQAKVIKTEDKTLEVQNTLNRCFCTLKLQKNVQSRYREKNLNYLGQSPQYPQMFEIRRVAVQQKYKRSSKKTYSTVRSVATKINKKYMIENKNLNSLRNVCPCKNEIINSTEMETIFPYTPTKFKETSSKTLLPIQNKFSTKNKIKGANKTSHGKKLNKKKSKRNINYNKQIFNENEIKEKAIPLKGFFCRCAALFTRKHKSINLINTSNINRKNKSNINDNDRMHVEKRKQTCNICFENLRSCKSDRRPMRQFVQIINTKKSKSFKIDDKCDNKCMKYPTVTLQIDQKRDSENNTIKENHKPHANNLKSTKFSSKIQAHSIKEKQKTDKILNVHCQKKVQEKLRKDKRILPPLKVHFVDVTSNANFLYESPNFKKHSKSYKKYLKSDKNHEEHYKYYDYCSSCGRKINKIELQKAAGDNSTNENNKRSFKYPNNRSKDIFKLNENTDNVCRGQYIEKPLFEMHLNSDDYNVINKEEIIDKVTKLRKKSIKDENRMTKSHKKSCRCCLCLFKKNKTGAHIHVAPKGSKIGRTLGKILGGSKGNTPTLEKPCTCGSYICSKKSQEIKTESHKMKGNKMHWEQCFCGSPICDRESATMRALSISPDKIKCICKRENEKMKKKIKAKKETREAKHRTILLKKQNKEDIIRRKKRRKRDKEMEKRINKKAGDLVLAAESAIDIGKLGITACTDVLRSVARCASDPKQAYNTLKAMKENPKLMARHFKSAFDDSGVAATARRVRLRCLAMRSVKKVKTTLERYAITNFQLHIADKDPKRRLPKKYKPKRVRERLDFGCSLYMASLRKRPYLSIYDRCPWFYPHFLSLVNVWKQFADLMLFLLAVVVWSPCILCMEACRAMMCCFFCTG